MTRQPKAYVNNSTVANIGKGLFASIDIKRGSIIAEFKGRLREPGEKLTSNRSNIYFNDERVLDCYPNDLASYANDAINFTGTRRQLMKALHSDEPFYTKHPNATVNAEIEIKDHLHRAFLIASEDIKKGTEIFCHYSFMYWFKKEITKIGFLEEEEIEKNGFPKRIFDYPGFKSYVKHFYPKCSRIEVIPFKGNFDIIVYLEGDNKILIPFDNFADQISKIHEDEL